MLRPLPTAGSPGVAIPDPKFNILAIDGGPSGGASARMLRVLARKQPGLISRAHLLAGNSFGSMIALYLASLDEEWLTDRVHETLRRLHILTDLYYDALALDFQVDRSLGPVGITRQVGAKVATAAWRLGRVGTGLGTLGTMENVRRLMMQPWRDDRPGAGLEDRTLRDLNRYVAILGFDVAVGPWDFFDQYGLVLQPRPWGVRVFHNLAPDPGEDALWDSSHFQEATFGSWADNDLPLIEVLLRSSALAPAVPIHAGFLDGAMFGNNPTMAAVALTLQFRRWLNRRVDRGTSSRPLVPVQGAEDLVALSIGGEDAFFAHGKLNSDLVRSRQHAEEFRRHRRLPDRMRERSLAARTERLSKKGLLEGFTPELQTAAHAARARLARLVGRSPASTEPQPGEEPLLDAQRAWGAWRWLIRNDNLALLVEAFMTGDSRGVAYQVDEVLPPGQHLRVTLNLPNFGKFFVWALFRAPQLMLEYDRLAIAWEIERPGRLDDDNHEHIAWDALAAEEGRPRWPEPAEWARWSEQWDLMLTGDRSRPLTADDNNPQEALAFFHALKRHAQAEIENKLSRIQDLPEDQRELQRSEWQIAASLIDECEPTVAGLEELREYLDWACEAELEATHRTVERIWRDGLLPLFDPDASQTRGLPVLRSLIRLSLLSIDTIAEQLLALPAEQIVDRVRALLALSRLLEHETAEVVDDARVVDLFQRAGVRRKDTRAWARGHIPMFIHHEVTRASALSEASKEQGPQLAVLPYMDTRVLVETLVYTAHPPRRPDRATRASHYVFQAESWLGLHWRSSQPDPESEKGGIGALPVPTNLVKLLTDPFTHQLLLDTFIEVWPRISDSAVDPYFLDESLPRELRLNHVLRRVYRRLGAAGVESTRRSWSSLNQQAQGPQRRRRSPRRPNR